MKKLITKRIYGFCINEAAVFPNLGVKKHMSFGAFASEKNSRQIFVLAHLSLSVISLSTSS